VTTQQQGNELKPGQFKLFKNNRKQEETHADLQGEIVLQDGSVHFLDCWINTSQAGNKWFKGRIGSKKTGTKAADDIPF